MGTLTITKAYGTGQALMEVHVDNFRNGLLTLFNTTKFDASNFDGSGISSDKFLGNTLIASNGNYIEFGATPDAWFGPDASGNLCYDTETNTTVLEFWANDEALIITNTEITIPSDILFKEGGSGRTLFQALSLYKVPVLEWESATSIKVQANSSNTDETIIFFPTFVASVEEENPSKYRKADITNEARGYQTDSTSTARGGRREGLSLTTNSWYAVYAAKVRSGTNYDADTAKFVLVFDSTLPTSSNESTLDGRYGSGCWVYLGLIRYGFGATGSSSSIPKFKQSNKGWTYFYGISSSGYGGVNLAYSTSNANNSSSDFYTLDQGMSGNVIPSVVGAIQVNVGREDSSDWWLTDASGDVVWQGGWQNDISTLNHGFQLEIPIDSGSLGGFRQTTKGTGSVPKFVCLTGFCDTYRTPRRHGVGI